MQAIDTKLKWTEKHSESHLRTVRVEKLIAHSDWLYVGRVAIIRGLYWRMRRWGSHTEKQFPNTRFNLFPPPLYLHYIKIWSNLSINHTMSGWTLHDNTHWPRGRKSDPTPPLTTRFNTPCLNPDEHTLKSQDPEQEINLICYIT